MTMTSHLLAICVCAFACGSWVLLQRWIARTEPEVKGPEDRCGGCGCTGGGCKKRRR
ncbi:MAG: hypothetical protein H6835_01835 [Planctomycetes bacterium]|nr:hypothetical protein [Planctomycetota bacterium]